MVKLIQIMVGVGFYVVTFQDLWRSRETGVLATKLGVTTHPVLD
jgi:hypothetical protein